MARNDGKDRTVARNGDYTRSQIGNIERHNERKNESYQNADIQLQQSEKNIYFKKPQGGYIETIDKVHSTYDVNEAYIEQIHQGMLRVTQGSAGTARRIFSGIGVDVAGKTGTAEEGASNTHSWFAGFAPMDNPQIAVVTSVYNENSLGSFGSEIAREVFMTYFGIGQESVTDTLDNKFLE